jgi:hypothetical protein
LGIPPEEAQVPVDVEEAQRLRKLLLLDVPSYRPSSPIAVRSRSDSDVEKMREEQETTSEESTKGKSWSPNSEPLLQRLENPSPPNPRTQLQILRTQRHIRMSDTSVLSSTTDSNEGPLPRLRRLPTTVTSNPNSPLQLALADLQSPVPIKSLEEELDEMGETKPTLEYLLLLLILIAAIAAMIPSLMKIMGEPQLIDPLEQLLFQATDSFINATTGNISVTL